MRRNCCFPNTSADDEVVLMIVQVRQLNSEAAMLMETHPTHAQDIEAKRDEISEAWVGLKDQVRI
jgi:hypothetical protein